MIQPTLSFKDNLQILPSIDDLQRIELISATGTVVATIENEAGKKGSLAVYNYLGQVFNSLDAEASRFGLALFAENTDDARARPGAHPNIDRLLDIVSDGEALTIHVVKK